MGALVCEGEQVLRETKSLRFGNENHAERVIQHPGCHKR